MGVMDKLKGMWKQPDDEGDYSDDYYDNQGSDYAPNEETASASKETPSESTQTSSKGNKVVSINRGPNSSFKVCVFKPERYGEETQDIAVELVNMNIVLLNLENTNKDMSRRIIDFLSGVTYANDGQITRVATNTYMITPKNIDVSTTDVMDGLESSGIYI
ncbi:MAG: cell division protein SepF [Acutalibacteraceae bacterium]